MSLSLLNKALLSSYKFSAYFTLLGCQMLFSMLVCLITRDLLGNPFKIPSFSFPLLKAGALMGCLYVGNVLAGMVGLKLVSVPMFLCVRRLTPLTILLVDYILYRKVADRGTHLAIAVSVIGTIVAGYESLSADGFGYLVTFCNNCITAMLAISQKRFAEDPVAVAAAAAVHAGHPLAVANTSAASVPVTSHGAVAPPAAAPAGGAAPAKLSVFGVLYVNSLIATPLAFSLALLTGEFDYVASFPHLHDSSFQFGFGVSTCMGIFLTYTAVLCTTYTSPMAYSMTGNFKDVVATGLGMFLFGGFATTVSAVSGLGLSFTGAGIFAYNSLIGARSKAAAPAPLPVPATAGSSGSCEETSVGGAGAALEKDAEAGAAAHETEAENAPLVQRMASGGSLTARSAGREPRV